MPRARPFAPLTVSPAEREELVSITRSRSMPQSLATRARIVLLAAEGESNTSIAEPLGLSPPTVGLWRKRYRTQRIRGLYDEPRPGGPRSIRDEEIATLLRKTLKTKPKDGTQWTCHSIAIETRLSKSTVQRLWKAFDLQPHRQKHSDLDGPLLRREGARHRRALPPSTRPRDRPCVDEKSQIQALGRTQPLLPLGLGYVEGVTHDYVRHGTTTLFAALEVGSGRVITQYKHRHRHQEFLTFLRHIEESVPNELDVHLIVDNCATRKHESICRWLAARPRFHVHSTPTYSSWFNQVEIWFNIITPRAIRRGTFRSIRDLVEKIETFVKHYNRCCYLFAWTATPGSILEKLERLGKTIAGTRVPAATKSMLLGRKDLVPRANRRYRIAHLSRSPAGAGKHSAKIGATEGRRASSWSGC
jgi:putative transposase